MTTVNSIIGIGGVGDHLARFLSKLRLYAASDDSSATRANLIALVLAWNTPFYPLYLWGTGGAVMTPGAWLTLGVFPVFAAVPAITRRYRFGGRVVLAVACIANTWFCTWLVGEAAGTELFLLPCIILSALLFRRGERLTLVAFLALPILIGVCWHGHYPRSPYGCVGSGCQAILWMNALGAAILLALFGYMATGLHDTSVSIDRSGSLPPALDQKACGGRDPGDERPPHHVGDG